MSHSHHHHNSQQQDGINNTKNHHSSHHDHHDHNHDEIDFNHTHSPLTLKGFVPAIITLVMLIIAVLLEKSEVSFFTGLLQFIWYFVAYLIVGLNVIKQAYYSIVNGQVFSEFLLMTIATIGAFTIGQNSEAVAVMLFYFVGELFQHAAASKAQTSIKALLDVRPDSATVIRNGETFTLEPHKIKVGETLVIKPGEKVALDGVLTTPQASFNTVALTGESKPSTIKEHQAVLAGMINLNTLATVEVTAQYEDTKLAQILTMVQEATAKKSKTQLFIAKFAKIYTPIVVLLALLIAFAPALLVDNYHLNTWVYRALVFLVISCPCALVISVPLGYFGGIGLASRNGILFKGGNFLDVLTEVDTIVMDKTGTLTKGVFTVQTIKPVNLSAEELLLYTASLEQHSTHPIATAITQYAKGNLNTPLLDIQEVEEIAGHGLKAKLNQQQILVGNARLLESHDIPYPRELTHIVESIVIVALDNKYAGYITVADQLKDDAKQAIDQLHKMGLNTVMLSGDKKSIVTKVAQELHIEQAYAELLPDGKVQHVEKLKAKGHKIAFIGDGINDAPVIALSDVGIAMGGLGSDAAIETADVVIQNDQPSKIAQSIKISKLTRKIVIQNIFLALSIKLLVLLLGALGYANIWQAIFADVGVSLLAILNSVRIQYLKIR